MIREEVCGGFFLRIVGAFFFGGRGVSIKKVQRWTLDASLFLWEAVSSAGLEIFCNYFGIYS